MAKTKLAVTTEYGTFTRTTARTYTHLVIANGCTDAVILARIVADLKMLKDDRRYYRGQLEGTIARSKDWTHPENPALTDAQVQAYLDKLQAKIEAIEGGITQDQTIAAAIAAPFDALGWCGRLDLARKLAASVAGTYRRTLIIDVATGKAVA